MERLKYDQRFVGAVRKIDKILNLGSGVSPIIRADNHDLYSYPGATIHFNLNEVPWPLESESYDMISAFHVMEHFGIGAILKPLSEIHRILKPGGMFIAELPDFPEVLKRYQGGDIGLLEIMYGTREKRLFDAHRWCYSQEVFANLCWASGFERMFVGPGIDYHSRQIPTFRVETIRS